MQTARLGWAPAGEDENVNELERRGAELLGKEAAVFVATCSLANEIAVLAQTEAGDGVLVDPDMHVITSESDWLSQIARVRYGEPAVLTCIENTHTRRGGTVLTVAQMVELAARTPRAHLDGARLANTSVALGVPLAALAAPVDTVAFSLNKGLGAPFGALLAGDAATIACARVHMKRLGAGSVHKAGIMAAAGLVALDGVDRIADDHRRARELAARIGATEPPTNIVVTDDVPLDALAARGVLALAFGGRTRLVTHRSVDDQDIIVAAEAIIEIRRQSAAR